jgi:rod shape-determining protein MreD
VFSTVAVILQSTVLRNVEILKVVPDIALCILVFSSYVNGTMTGQVSGFFSGLLYDFISAAPLGLNCIYRTIIGALAGLFKGALFLDYFFMPVILCTLATIIKAITRFLLNLILNLSIEVYSITTSTFWIEIGYNAVCAPLIFLLLRHFKPILIGRS